MISEFAYYKKNEQPSKVQMPKQVVWEEGRGMGVEVSNFIDTFFYQIIHRRFLEGGVRSRINRIGGGGVYPLNLDQYT